MNSASHRARPTAARAGLVLAGAAVFVVAGNLILGAGSALSLRGNTWSMCLLAVVLALAGRTLVDHVPDNPVGTLLVLAGASASLSVLADVYADGAVGQWLGEWVPWIVYGLVPVMLLVFPDGRLPGRRWRPAAALAVGGAVVAPVCLFVAATVEPTELFRRAGPTSPVAYAALVGAMVGVVLSVLAALLAAASLVVRWRRASSSERAQLRCMFVAAVVVLAGIAWDVAHLPGGWPVGALAVPTAAVVAILRHRLWDLRPFVNRAVLYGILMAYAAVVYTAVVALASVGIFGGADAAPADLQAPWVLATVGVLVTGNPVSRRVQLAAGRLLYGFRNDPYAAFSEFGRRLGGDETANGGDGTDPVDVRHAVLETLCDALQVPFAALESDDGSGLPVVEHGERCGTPERFPLTYRGVDLGCLAVCARSTTERFTARDRRLIEDYGRVAGIALFATRLTLELQESRGRIVRSREEERRRLRRDLHDGLGPILSGVRMGIEAQIRNPRLDPQVGAGLVRLGDQLETGMTEVRRLLEGLRPTVLDEVDLVSALRAETARRNATAPEGRPRFVVAVDDDIGRLPAAVEDAAYRIALEAINNVVKHADADECVISLRAGDTLRLEIIDDGRGPTVDPQPAHQGVGLQSMRERAQEINGRSTVGPNDRGGTTVSVLLPLHEGDHLDGTDRPDATDRLDATARLDATGHPGRDRRG